MTASAEQQAQVAARRARVLRARAAGLTYQAIADSEPTLSTAAAAVQDAQRALDGRRSELARLADLHLVLEAERLDGLTRQTEAVMARAGQAGDQAMALRAVDRLLRISAQRSRLLGFSDDHIPKGGDGPGPAQESDLERARRRRRDRRASYRGAAS